MRHCLWAINFWVLFCFCSVGYAYSPREVINLNREWKYMQGDLQGAEKTDYDDNNWETIGIPHSFSIPYFMSKDFYTGYGWYRKRVFFTERNLSGKIFLEFDGVFQEAEIFLNGKFIDRHCGGYTGFSVDITDAAQKGDNVLAIRVNNLWQPTVAPRGGEHVFSGGIYRNVRLVLKSSTYIGWYGTFVTTSGLDASNGKYGIVDISTEICHSEPETGNFRLVSNILSSEGRIIASAQKIIQLKGNTNQVVKQQTERIEHPFLWHPSHPVLYKLESLLFKGDELIDREETSFGFRWFEWTKDHGFFLNGKHLYFKGINVHQDQAGWGDAVTDAAARRDVALVKQAGFDMIRGSHYPHSPAFSKACDEEGVLFWSEAPFWATAGEKKDGYWTASAYPVRQEDCKEFEENVLQQLEEMIRIHRNHPSIIAWSMCNEPFFTAPETMHGIRKLLERMVARTHQLDPTRPAAIGGAQRPLGTERIDLIGDIVGYNGDGSTILDFQQPPIPNMVTEYGSTTSDRPGEYIPGWGDLQKNDAWKGVEWRSGQAIWCGFDHGSIFGEEMGKMGIVDYFRIPKRSWYWYRNAYANIAPPIWSVSGIPARLRLEASQYTGIRADGTDDVQLTVTVLDETGRELSNSPAVRLTLLSGPGEFPTGSSILFEADSDIRIMDGKAAIAFRSYYAGESVIEATSPDLEPARVKLTFSGAPVYQEGETPQVKNRPYIPFALQKQHKMQSFGLNNPAFGSSAAQGHATGYAADGKLDTWWEPENSDRKVYWTLDTERFLMLDEVCVRFAGAAPYQYKIEVSENNKDWIVVSDKTGNHVPLDSDLIKSDRQVKMHYLRISFPHSERYVTPKLAEVEVRGQLY